MAAALHNNAMQGPDMACVLPPSAGNAPPVVWQISKRATRDGLISNWGYVHFMCRSPARGSFPS